MGHQQPKQGLGGFKQSGGNQPTKNRMGGSHLAVGYSYIEKSESEPAQQPGQIGKENCGNTETVHFIDNHLEGDQVGLHHHTRCQQQRPKTQNSPVHQKSGQPLAAASGGPDMVEGFLNIGQH